MEDGGWFDEIIVSSGIMIYPLRQQFFLQQPITASLEKAKYFVYVMNNFYTRK